MRKHKAEVPNCTNDSLVKSVNDVHTLAEVSMLGSTSSLDAPAMHTPQTNNSQQQRKGYQKGRHAFLIFLL